MEIKVSIEDKELKSGLAALQSRMSDLSPVMKVISEIVYASIRRNFEAGGRPQRWAPSLRVKREGGQTLIRKGTGGGLLGSLIPSHTKDSATVSANKEYAAILHFGGKTAPRIIKAKNGKALFWPGARHPVKSVNHPGSQIPPRPFLMVQNEDWTEIQSVINNYLSMR